MASTTTKVVSIRLKNEVADYYADKNLKEIIEKLYDKGSDELVEKLKEISFIYDIDAESLVKNIGWMLEQGKIFVGDGSLKWNPKAKNPDYISLDDRIDLMNISEREKDRIKRQILSELERMVNGGTDDWA